MNLVPFRLHRCLLLRHDAKRLPQIACLEAVVPDQFRLAVRPRQVDLRMAVADRMDMGRLMVIDEDDEAQSGLAMNGRPVADNLSGWVIQLLRRQDRRTDVGRKANHIHSGSNSPFLIGFHLS
jgi:hypothetical protein